MSSQLIGKTVDASAVEGSVYRIYINDLNANGTVFGGLIMSECDRIAGVVAERHSGSPCATASVDAIKFLAPAGQGDNLIFKASINRSWNSSMEIGVKVIAECSRQQTPRHIVSACLTFVALDENHQPCAVPPVIPETQTQKRRFEEAQLRKEARLRHSQEIAEKRSSES